MHHMKTQQRELGTSMIVVFCMFSYDEALLLVPEWRTSYCWCTAPPTVSAKSNSELMLRTSILEIEKIQLKLRICFKCFTYPCRYVDLVPTFGQPVPHLCMITNMVVDDLFEILPSSPRHSVICKRYCSLATTGVLLAATWSEVSLQQSQKSTWNDR